MIGYMRISKAHFYQAGGFANPRLVRVTATIHGLTSRGETMPKTQYEREEDQIERDYEMGFIGIKERNERIRDLERSYREDAECAAHEAYEREMENW